MIRTRSSEASNNTVIATIAPTLDVVERFIPGGEFRFQKINNGWKMDGMIIVIKRKLLEIAKSIY